MKLQKLTYLSYGWWLAFGEKPIIAEQPQVWRYGPVFNSMYFALNRYGSNSIYDLQKDVPIGPVPTIDVDDTDASGLAEWVYSKYGIYDSMYLSDLTHKKDSPWYTVASKHSFNVPKNLSIPGGVIRDHYKKLAAENDLL